MNSCKQDSAHRGCALGEFMTVWYNVITLATPKGGTGKSTLSRGLAAYWFALGRKPALVDADPTETLAKRYNPAGPLGGVPVIAEPEERVGEVIEELRGRHAPVIVDTAGFRNRTNITALVATDLALIPLKPAIEDVDAAVGHLRPHRGDQRHAGTCRPPDPDGHGADN